MNCNFTELMIKSYVFSNLISMLIDNKLRSMRPAGINIITILFQVLFINLKWGYVSLPSNFLKYMSY